MTKAATKPKAEVCDLFGISAAQIERYFKQGMPHTKKGRNVVLPWPEARTWYFAYLEQKGYKRAAPQSLDEARRRRATAEAELAELELARERDETMRVEDGAATLADGFARARSKILNLPPRIAGVIVGVPTKAEALARIEPLVLEVLAELHAAEDVPADDPETLEDDERTDDTDASD